TVHATRPRRRALPRSRPSFSSVPHTPHRTRREHLTRCDAHGPSREAVTAGSSRTRSSPPSPRHRRPFRCRSGRRTTTVFRGRAPTFSCHSTTVPAVAACRTARPAGTHPVTPATPRRRSVGLRRGQPHQAPELTRTLCPQRRDRLRFV